MPKFQKEIIERLEKTCSICGRKMKVIFYKDQSYCGGHYFGKIPLSTKEGLQRSLKAETTKKHLGNLEIQVLKRNPKPYKYEEYWECPKCYWGK